VKINSVSTKTFGAYVDGEIAKVVKISMNAGCSKKHVQKLINEVHKVCSKPEDCALFYFRKYYPLGSKEAKIRCGVKIYKDGIGKEININPRNCTPKTLLEQMVIGIKDLASGKAKSNSKHIAYSVGNEKSWLSKYQESPYCKL